MGILIIISIIFSIGTIVGLWKLFEKAGRKGWEIIIPFYNFYIWLKIIKKPLWWYIFILTPFLNVFMLMLMIVELVKCFNKFSLFEQGAAVIFPFVYLPYIGFSEKEVYVHPDKRPEIKRTVVREWVDAIIFAVIAATIIRTFFMEAYTIPSSSMEKTLLIGDFLFVSKITYGPRIPNTPIAFPFAHHTLPFTESVKSYVEWIKLPYYRFPGMSSGVKRNDCVVFNYPDGDTLTVEKQSNYSYYQMVRDVERMKKEELKENYRPGMGRKYVWENFTVIARPVDKRENFIKRCVGISGDVLYIKNRQLFINGSPAFVASGMQYKYDVITDGSTINPDAITQMDITDGEQDGPGHYVFALTQEKVEKIKQFANVKKVQVQCDPPKEFHNDIFPYDSVNYQWNKDNFGPITIPKKGATIAIDIHNISLYTRIIGVYEHNKLKVVGDKIFINGIEAKQYTFKMNYYWMMGDNRHCSADSRYWGFVPEDHVVGKAVFVWLSLDKNRSLLDGKIRWSKIFRFIK
jgi:signal peptidase I